ncbi:MAG: hypothetical protein JSU63_11805 [Phycisphaerales bacterium]|nr:MAG: hypothetical protein JSU63_11805 [Phycisphaerales bacterium]
MRCATILSCGGLVLFSLIINSGCGSRSTEPRITDYSDSGCLPGSGEDKEQTLADLLGAPEDYPGCHDDQIEVTIQDRAVKLVHRNATYNCCPDDIAVTLSVEGTVVRVTEEEDLTTGGCFCLCCRDLEALIVSLIPGEYTLQYCWQDHETGEEECHTEDIVIPAFSRP